MINKIRSFIGEIGRFVFSGYNRQLEELRKNKTYTSIFFGERGFKNLYVVDYDRNFITFSDDKGVEVTYSRNSLESFSKTIEDEDSQS